MSTNTTPNLGLSQWEAGDPVLREDFNRDNAALDAACAAIPRMVSGSYPGAGAYGEENPCTLSFDLTPQLVIVSPDSTLSLYGALILVRGQDHYNGTGFLDSSNRGLGLAVRWEGNSVSWYCESGGSAEKQFNENGTGYRYFAIGNGI